jgi:hypothetical protein
MHPQKSPEWHALRAEHFTASELGPWVTEPVKISLTVEGIKKVLDCMGIPRKGITGRDDLLALLPNRDAYAELCEGAQTAIIGKIKQERLAKMRNADPETLTMEESIYLERELELAAKRERDFSYNIPVKYGNLLEPFARSFYESRTGYEVTEVGFVSQDGFGCSPDGLVYATEFYDHSGNVQVIDKIPAHGIEIKCPVPETHIAWIRAGGLPDCHKLQVHASMICCEVSRWDFLSYCPGEVPLLVTVEWDEFTDKLAAGLRVLVAEKRKMKAWLGELWKAEFGKGES